MWGVKEREAVPEVLSLSVHGYWAYADGDKQTAKTQQESGTGHIEFEVPKGKVKWTQACGSLELKGDVWAGVRTGMSSVLRWYLEP